MVSRCRFDDERNGKVNARSGQKYGSKCSKNLIRERSFDDGSVVREMGPIVYGYSFKIGEDGKPVVRKFGNLNTFPISLSGRFSVSDQREPVVDIIKDVDKLKIIAEVPGVSKSDLRITANENSLTIESISGERRYNKKVDASRSN